MTITSTSYLTRRKNLYGFSDNNNGFTMLRACFDCITGRLEQNDVRQDSNVIGRGVQNGAQRVKPPWPPRHNMFHLPKELNNRDSISLSGHLHPAPNSFVIMLAKDEMEIFKFHADFNTNKMTVVVNDENIEVQDFETRELFSDSRYKFRLDMISEYEGNFINVFIEDVPIIMVRIDESLQDITHVLLDGDHNRINNISFQFA